MRQKATKPVIRFEGFTDDWEQRKVGELFEVTRGLVLATSKTSPIQTKDYIYPVYSSQTKNHGLMGYYTEYLFENAITWTTDGANAGTVNYREGRFYSTNVNGVLLSNRGYANKAVAEILNNIAWKHVSKVGNPKLMNNVMSEIVIKVPKIAEQKEMSNFFKQLDDTIALHQRQLEALEKTKKSFLQKMFPKKDETKPEIRFAGFTDDWEQRKWIDTVDISTNMVNPKSGEYDELLHIGPGNIESFTGRILNNVNTVKEDSLISSKFYFNSGDIIYGKINPQLAKYALVDFEGLASADAYVLNSKNGVIQSYLFYILQHRRFYKYSVSVSMRTGMPKINRDELDQFSYLVPNIQEQQKIGTFFKQLDETIALHQRQLEALETTKKSFLQKMFI